ncbi:Q9ZPR1 Cell division control protein [Tieghemostelium lacteum]|uniref:Q9ZPR1 Cell division control protein n=1 Tax=Tieghemostelium lacteum TaxID=361077 RepID=A0A152A451_TIELA|nr:Q9ZPR1 Cell division control protein [Tieghemostelium lacteum]|eukprot:KYR01033.1 Q9ZPR1 Cell division control protein [Tieghemostelium lacteum]
MVINSISNVDIIKSKVGGLRKEIEFIIDRLDFFYSNERSDGNSKIFSNGGLVRLSYPCNLLIQGRSGCGKTLLVETILQTLRYQYKIINSTYLYQSDEGETERYLEQLFQQSSLQSPFILVFEEIDAVTLNRSLSDTGYIEKRVSSYFLKLLEKNSNSRDTKWNRVVFVIGITCRMDSMDACYFNSGKFDQVIQIPIPLPSDRGEILDIIFSRFRNYNENRDHYKMISNQLSMVTHGYVGADLESLSKGAVLNRLKNGSINLEQQQESIVIEYSDFLESLKITRPSILNEFKLKFDRVSFEEIGGLDEILQKIKIGILSPIFQKELLGNLGIEAPRGVLLYGPPGNGKSMIARAIASYSSNINFISVNSTDIIDPVVGESEKNLQRLFKTLRESSPAILFLDQIEVLAKQRGFDTSAEQSSDRLLSCLLTEMDGISSSTSLNSKFIVLGATTRLDMLDSTILRPGRFDYQIEIPNPSQISRIDILKKITKSMPLNDNVDLTHLSQLTDGYSGADLNNLCKEAALLALRQDIHSQSISINHFTSILKK